MGAAGVAVTPRRRSDLKLYRPTNRSATVANTGPKSSMHLLRAARNQGERWLRKVGRIGGEPMGVEPDHTAAGQLERGRQTRVHLKAGRHVQHEPGISPLRSRFH